MDFASIAEWRLPLERTDAPNYAAALAPLAKLAPWREPEFFADVMLEATARGLVQDSPLRLGENVRNSLLNHSFDRQLLSAYGETGLAVVRAGEQLNVRELVARISEAVVSETRFETVVRGARDQIEAGVREHASLRPETYFLLLVTLIVQGAFAEGRLMWSPSSATYSVRIPAFGR